MRILYNLSFLVFGIIYLPFFIVTKRYRYGLADRFGFLSGRLRSIVSGKKIIWIHAVSVGEIKAAGILAPLLRKAFPSHVLVFSTVTHTGNKVARTIATPEEEVFYLPFDISFIADRVVKSIKPELFLCLETELWPNLIDSLHRFNTKVILVNGRISDRSYSGYKNVRFIVSRILSKFSLILAQSDQDAKRFLDLGAPKENVSVTGNLKFDLPMFDPGAKRREIRDQLRIAEDEVLLIAGSTHRGEEEKIIKSFFRLKKYYNKLRLLIAPRHVERTEEIERLLTRDGYPVIRFSRINTNDGREAPKDPILILDIIGNLKTVYSAADIVFIGGSLVKKGGQNPIEPAALSKPVIFGRFTFNFQDVVRLFIENGAAIQVDTEDEFYSAVKLLLDNPEQRKNLGINARDTVVKNSGSSQRTISFILSKVKNV